MLRNGHPMRAVGKSLSRIIVRTYRSRKGTSDIPPPEWPYVAAPTAGESVDE